MTKCLNDPKSSFKGNEPSPKGFGYCAHAEKVGTIKKGKDGKKWIIISTKKNIVRWTHYSENKSKKNQNKEENKKLDYSKFVCYHKVEKRGRFKIFKDRLCGILSPDKKHLYKWIDYNTFQKKLTEIPKLYVKKIIKKDFREKYYCGNKKRIFKNNEEYKNIKKLVKNKKYYFIHDNYFRPFIVYLNNNSIQIYKIPNNMFFALTNYSLHMNKNKWMYIEHVLTISKPLQYWIGKSPKNDRTNYSNSFGKEFDGNTILVQKDKETYIYIGEEILSFKLKIKNNNKNKIIYYVSHIGNNDVPYPYAIDSLGNYYLMVEKKIIHITKNTTLQKSAYDSMDKKIDPYNVYYFKENTGYKIENISHLHVIQKRGFN